MIFGERLCLKRASDASLSLLTRPFLRPSFFLSQKAGLSDWPVALLSFSTKMASSDGASSQSPGGRQSLTSTYLSSWRLLSQYSAWHSQPTGRVPIPKHVAVPSGYSYSPGYHLFLQEGPAPSHFPQSLHCLYDRGIVRHFNIQRID